MTEEKLVVLEFFKDQPHGRFLEIGANDGLSLLTDEPAGGLLDKGWNGVYCEPNPASCDGLIRNIGPNQARIDIVNCAITVEGGLKTFYAVTAKTGSSGISSFDPNWHTQMTKERQNRISFIRPITINTITFDQLISVVGNNFDFICIDVEAEPKENDIFVRTMNFDKLPHCKMLCIEGITETSFEYLAQFGFKPYKSQAHLHSYFNFFFTRN